MIACLYVDHLGPYPKLDGVDCFDGRWHRAELRDARLYSGPHPVVAHPPCGPWGRLRHLYKGSEHDCAPRAVEQVRAFGGALEHPAGSKLWGARELPLPALAACPAGKIVSLHCQHHVEDGATCCRCGLGGRDSFGGYTIEIDQCEWGHVARKRTWLYLVGVPRSALELPPFPGRQPTHYASGGRTPSSRNGGAVPVGMKVCSAQQRRRTPVALAEYLVRLARAAAESRRAA